MQDASVKMSIKQGEDGTNLNSRMVFRAMVSVIVPGLSTPSERTVATFEPDAREIADAFAKWFNAGGMK